MKTCEHSNKGHLCDNGPTSGGEYWWCPDCGSLGAKGQAELKWTPPNHKMETFKELQKGLLPGQVFSIGQ